MVRITKLAIIPFMRNYLYIRIGQFVAVMRSKLKLILLSCICAVTMSSAPESRADNFKWVRHVRQDVTRNYSGRLSAFLENGCWGFVTMSGKIQIKPEYEEVRDFQGSRCIVKRKGRWGVIDDWGNVIHKFEYDSIAEFKDGAALASCTDGRRYYLFENGKKIELPSDNYEFHSYSNGYTRIKDRKTGKWGFADKWGIIRINPTFDKAGDFKGGRALVVKDGKTYSVNKSGDMKKLAFDYDDSVVVFASGAGCIRKPDGNFRLFNGRHRLLDPEYVEVNDFYEGIALVREPGGIPYYMNEKGAKVMTLTDYEEAGNFSEGKAWVRSGSKYGYINRRGILVVDTLLSSASDFRNGVAYVTKGDRRGLIRMVTPDDPAPKVEVSGITLSEDNGNGIIEADETFSISLSVKNIGKEALIDAYVVLELEPEKESWFECDSIRLTLGTVKPESERIVSFTGTSNTDIVTGKVKADLVVEADNVFEYPSSQYTFEALGIDACVPVIETSWVYTDDHSPLLPGKRAVMKLNVRNSGTHVAKDMAVKLSWPEGIIFGEKVITVPSLEAGQSAEVYVPFFVSEGPGNDKRKFTVGVTLEAYSRRVKNFKYVTFETGILNEPVDL